MPLATTGRHTLRHWSRKPRVAIAPHPQRANQPTPIMTYGEPSNSFPTPLPHPFPPQGANIVLPQILQHRHRRPLFCATVSPSTGFRTSARDRRHPARLERSHTPWLEWRASILLCERIVADTRQYVVDFSGLGAVRRACS